MMKSLGVFLVLASLLSCSPGTEPVSNVRLESPVLLAVHEDYSIAGRDLRLDLETEQQYACFNYAIVVNRNAMGPGFSFEIKEVVAPSICLTAPGPARASVDLGPLAPGSYPLRLTANGTIADGLLVVTPDSVSVVGAEGPWTKFPSRVFHRLPDGAIWGTIGWGPADQATSAQEFLDALEAAGAQVLHLAPGAYESFVVASDGTVLPPDGHGFYFARSYVYRFDGDREVVPDLQNPFKDRLWISTYGDRGETWYSWVLRAGG